MHVKDARQLQKQWGDKPCDHPEFEKETYQGGSTGDYVCTQCGEAFWYTEAEKIIAERKSKKSD